MGKKLRDSIYIPGLEEDITKFIESMPKPGVKQAMTELQQVLEHCNREVTARIPKEFYDFLDKYGDRTWEGNLDFSLKLNDMDLLPDTRVLLSMVYGDFLCSEVERSQLIEKDQKEAEAMGETYGNEFLMKLIQTGEQ